MRLLCVCVLQHTRREQTHTHTPVAGDEVDHVALQFEQCHAVPRVTVERIRDELLQVHPRRVCVLHTGLWRDNTKTALKTHTK